MQSLLLIFCYISFWSKIKIKWPFQCHKQLVSNIFIVTGTNITRNKHDLLSAIRIHFLSFWIGFSNWQASCVSSFTNSTRTIFCCCKISSFKLASTYFIALYRPIFFHLSEGSLKHTSLHTDTLQEFLETRSHFFYSKAHAVTPI